MPFSRLLETIMDSFQASLHISQKMERIEAFLMRNDLHKVLKDLQASRLIQSIDIDRSKDPDNILIWTFAPGLKG